MEVIGRGRDVRDLDISFRAKLEIPLQTRRAMLRTLAFIAVRPQADETVAPQPLGLRRSDILVEADLSAIGEVAELRVPENEALRIGQSAPIFTSPPPLLGHRQHQHPQTTAP